jgi:chaperone modulatory protein CbpM
MTHDFDDARALDERSPLALDDLAAFAGFDVAELREWVACGLIDPLDPSAGEWRFEARTLVVVRRAARLKRDFELDAHSLAVVMRFVERVEALEAELRRLRARGS